jgi:hypothetical protein
MEEPARKETRDMTHPEDGDGRRQVSSSAPVMSAAEKLAVEWEARHDVAARHHHASPRAVQEYLSHQRAEERHRAPAPQRHAAAPEPAGGTEPPGRPPRQPSWLRRLGSGRRG